MAAEYQARYQGDRVTRWNNATESKTQQAAKDGANTSMLVESAACLLSG
jgi:hypothetical protein